MSHSLRDGLVSRPAADGESPSWQDARQWIDRETAGFRVLVEMTGGEGIVSGGATQLSDIGSGTAYPAVVAIVYDDSGRPWLYKKTGTTTITFNVASTAAGEGRVYLVPSKFSGDTTAATGAIDGFTIVADDVANGAPTHSLLLGSTTITASACATSFTPDAGATRGEAVLQSLQVNGALEMDGDLNHDGSNAGFFGVAPTTRPTAYTQTYSTADKTLAAYTPDDESGAYTGQDNAQGGSVYAKVADLNALRTAYETLRALAEDTTAMLNSVVDDLQALGLLQ